MKSKKIIAIIFIAFFTFLFLSSCTKNDEIVFSTENPESGQKFKIINGYNLYANFIEEASQDQQQEEIDELYQTMIIDSVYEDCFEDGEHLHMIEFFLNEAPTDFVSLNNLIEEIDQEPLMK